MRIKNDTVFKHYIIPETMDLTNEQLGALIRKVMIDNDDKQGQQRYVDQDEEIIEYCKEKEEEWENDFKKMIKNPIVRSAYTILKGQVGKSERAFREAVKRTNDKKGENQNEETEEPIPRKKKPTKTTPTTEETKETITTKENGIIINWLDDGDVNVALTEEGQELAIDCSVQPQEVINYIIRMIRNKEIKKGDDISIDDICFRIDSERPF